MEIIIGRNSQAPADACLPIRFSAPLWKPILEMQTGTSQSTVCRRRYIGKSKRAEAILVHLFRLSGIRVTDAKVIICGLRQTIVVDGLIER